jgi:protein-arginine kinase activator protein McsA
MAEHQRMTRIMTCDRCATTHEYHFKTNTNNTGQQTITPENYSDQDGLYWAHIDAKHLLETTIPEQYDLCPDCKRTFRQWWRDGKQQ